MAMTENLVSGKKYRILTNAANDTWDRISFWAKAVDVYYDDGTTAEANKPNAMLKRSTAYTVGTIAYEPTAPSWVMLRCTTAGTTAASVPSTYSTISSTGSTITDGTAKFAVYDVRPTTTLSTSAYQIPAMSLVNSLNSELTANSKKFYFDYQNSKYGYNTSSNRDASTFVPFGGASEPSDIKYTTFTWSYGEYGASHTFTLESEPKLFCHVFIMNRATHRVEIAMVKGTFSNATDPVTVNKDAWCTFNISSTASGSMSLSGKNCTITATIGDYNGVHPIGGILYL